jgi:hypothetical protein
MSEFQMYQFRAIDRPLNENEKAEVGSWSSRTAPSNYAANFVYSYGDFPRNDEKTVENYFDLLLYVANWGTRQLIFRFPLNSIDAKAIKQYSYEDEWCEIRLKKCPNCYLLNLRFSEDEGGGYWIEENDFSADRFIELRQAIMDGDYRALYLLWVSFKQNQDEEYSDEDEDDWDGEEEMPRHLPEVPANLGKFSPSLTAFADFFNLSQDLITALQGLSVTSETQAINYSDLLDKLSEPEKTDFLKRFLAEEPQLLRALKKRLGSFVDTIKTKGLQSPDIQEINRLEKIAQQTRQQKEKKAQQEAHTKKMQELMPKKEKMWQQVEDELNLKNAGGYDRGVAILKSLKELATFENKKDEFNIRIIHLKAKYARSTTLMERFRKAGLE